MSISYIVFLRNFNEIFHAQTPYFVPELKYTLKKYLVKNNDLKNTDHTKIIKSLLVFVILLRT